VPVVLKGVVMKGAIVLTAAVRMTGVVIPTDVAIPVGLRSTGTVNGVGPQPTAVMPGNPSRSPYPQYGDAESVHFLTMVLLAQAASHSPRSVYGRHVVATGHPSTISSVPEYEAEEQHPNHEWRVLKPHGRPEQSIA